MSEHSQAVAPKWGRTKTRQSDETFALTLVALGSRYPEVDGQEAGPTTRNSAGIRGICARMVDISAAPAEASVLDAGSGLGDLSRYLAERFELEVVGIEQAADDAAVAHGFAEYSRAAAMITCNVSSLVSLPFARGMFDAVYSQYVAMRLADRDRLYAEIRRVMRRGGVFGFCDVVASDTVQTPIYPTPWASTAADNFLLDEDETLAALHRASLRVEAWEDVTGEQRTWVTKLASAAEARFTDFPEALHNYARNLREGRFRVVIARARAS